MMVGLPLHFGKLGDGNLISASASISFFCSTVGKKFGLEIFPSVNTVCDWPTEDRLSKQINDNKNTRFIIPQSYQQWL